MERHFKLTIIRGRHPPADIGSDVNRELQWFCTSLGLVGNRDKNLSMFRIFIAIIKAQQRSSELSSDAIATETNLTRATVIHHLSKLQSAGLVREEHERYALAVTSTEALVKHLRDEVEQSMAELERVSKRIDEKLGLR